MRRPLLAALLAFLLCASRGAGAATLAVTGDVAGPDDGAVSDAVLAASSVTAVLLTGDTNNDSMTPLSGYRKLYAGGFGRLLAKIRPAPGNHDAVSVPPFSGYQAFWAEAAHAPEMYYSWDIDGWHIISLDSIALEDGGKSAAAQLDWLKGDLAAHPKAPVLAYWHHPLFSRARHEGHPRMKPFWEALYAHGPALVINGHNHVYERYAPMDPEGRAAEESRGIREFEISPGGAKPSRYPKKKMKEGPDPERFHGGAGHAGFFVLEPGGAYRYAILAVTTGRAPEVVDSGAGNLLKD